MDTRHLHLQFLQLMQVMTTVCGTFDSACLFPIKNACMNHVCPTFICPWDRNQPPDMTALPAVDRHILWQPWSHQNGNLYKKAPEPATPESGAAMEARHLRLLFLQVGYSYHVYPIPPS